MGNAGEREVRTQKRAIELFLNSQGFSCLRFWKNRCGNSNVEEGIFSRNRKRPSLMPELFFVFGRLEKLGMGKEGWREGWG
jgi:hypothetical protein